MLRALLIALLSTPLLTYAQEPRFEAASIKPRADAGPVGMDGARSIGAMPGGGGFAMIDGPVAALIRYAYPTVSREIAGAPSWVETDRYDVQARAASVTTRAQREAMLRALLAERFALRARYETVERPITTSRSTVERPSNGGRADLPSCASCLRGETMVIVVFVVVD